MVSHYFWYRNEIRRSASSIQFSIRLAEATSRLLIAERVSAAQIRHRALVIGEQFGQHLPRADRSVVAVWHALHPGDMADGAQCRPANLIPCVDGP
jgi:hypothetical protein